MQVELLPHIADFFVSNMKNVGKIFGNWLIKERSANKSADGHALYVAECIKCGYITNRLRLSQAHLSKKCHHPLPANTFSCSNLRCIYDGMCARCNNKNNKDYRYYGARGIVVCRKWLEHPEEFNKWAIKVGYKVGLTLDRKDPNKGYCEENCRWVSREYNSKFKRTSTVIEINGVLDTLSGWAKRKNKPRMFFVHKSKKVSKDELVEFIKSTKEDSL